MQISPSLADPDSILVADSPCEGRVRYASSVRGRDGAGRSGVRLVRKVVKF